MSLLFSVEREDRSGGDAVSMGILVNAMKIISAVLEESECYRLVIHDHMQSEK
jgi:hypothetical protein